VLGHRPPAQALQTRSVELAWAALTCPDWAARGAQLQGQPKETVPQRQRWMSEHPYVLPCHFQRALFQAQESPQRASTQAIWQSQLRVPSSRPPQLPDPAESRPLLRMGSPPRPAPRHPLLPPAPLAGAVRQSHRSAVGLVCGPVPPPSLLVPALPLRWWWLRRVFWMELG
jgi:hypothetical protein